MPLAEREAREIANKHHMEDDRDLWKLSARIVEAVRRAEERGRLEMKKKRFGYAKHWVNIGLLRGAKIATDAHILYNVFPGSVETVRDARKQIAEAIRKEVKK